MSSDIDRIIQDSTRLQKLRDLGILDTPFEEAFDRLTRITSKIIDAPVSLVSLVDADRQWFKSYFGLPEPWASQRETDLEHSFCKHVVATHQPLIVEDARTVDFLKDNLAIPDLNVIAYLGIPLTTDDGVDLGSFCVIDSKPRKWTEREIEIVKDLAQAVMTEIELRAEIRTRKKIEDEQARLEKLMQALAGVQTSQQFLQALTPHIEALGAQLGEVFAITNDTNQVTPMMELTAQWASVNYAGSLMPMGQRIPADSDSFAQLWLNDPDKAYFITDSRTDERLSEFIRKQMSQLQIAACLILPLNQSGRLIGVVSYTWTAEHVFTDDEKRFFNALPSLLAPVAENLQLIARLGENVQRLEIANRFALENARIKSEFLATISHELRTPLNAVEGFTSIMLNKMGGVEFNDKAERYITKVQTNSKRLLSLINDFLDISRIESGRLQMALLPFNPHHLAKKWQADLSILAEQKQLTFAVELDPMLPTMLIGDEEAISKITLNLLSNAIKFTEQGGITLRMSSTGSTWSISVADTGIGIPPHAREYIFDEFRQLDQSAQRKYGGTGLGLAIVQKLTRAMKGTITLESEVGKGSTFTLTLPAQTSLIPLEVTHEPNSA